MPHSTKQETGSVINKSSITIATLAKNTGIISASPALTRGGKMLSYSANGGLNGATLGDGPLIFGVMSGDLTLAELEAYLELEGPLTPADVTASEVASRGKRIRVLGTLSASNPEVALDNRKMSGLRFAEAAETTNAWNTWVYNPGAAFTTGATLELVERVFVEWNPSG